MNDEVRRIADAVLYEGHMLYPYRLSSLKNRQRWTLGGVYPPAYARTSGDRSRISFEALLEGAEPRVALEVRFLRIERADGREEAGERVIGVGLVAEPPGLVTSEVAELRPGLHLLSAALENTSDWSGSDRGEAMLHTFASAHAVASVEGGAFMSPRESNERLRQEGLWPVLVGERGDRSTLLASPIVLDDYPQVAPESPGDFFDGCEIDQLLALSILALSEEEKREVRAGDRRAREILERTEAMTQEELLRLHGTWRDP